MLTEKFTRHWVHNRLVLDIIKKLCYSKLTQFHNWVEYLSVTDFVKVARVLITLRNQHNIFFKTQVKTTVFSNMRCNSTFKTRPNMRCNST